MDEAKPKTNNRWVRFVFESVVIVGSILLALAADAWFEDRQDRVQEQVELRGLYEQLQATRVALQRAIEADRAGRENTRHLIELLEASDAAVPVEVSDSVVRLVSRTTFFDPPITRFESIIASGRLVLIEDDGLRAAVADWPSRVRDPQFAANSRREMFRNQLIPYLTEHVDVDEWLNTPPTGLTVTIRRDVTLINLLKSRFWLDQVVLSQLQDLMSPLDELLARTEAAIREAS